MRRGRQKKLMRRLKMCCGSLSASAPDEGAEIGELMRITGMSSPDHLPASGRACPELDGPFRSAVADGGRPPPRSLTVSDRLTVCLVSRLARASARKRAYTPAETNDETSTHRRRRGGDAPSQPRTSTSRSPPRSHGAAPKTEAPAPGPHARSSYNDSSGRLIPMGKLPPDERHRRAEHAKRAYMLRLAKRAVAARKAS